MEISVRQLNIRPKFTKTLLVNGIVLVSHLHAFNTKLLAQKTKLPLDECEEILAATKPKRPHHIMKASELMVRPFEKIATLIPGLDSALAGGIRCGQITEISGEAGAGKSNLASQIGMLVMMPENENGYDGSVLFIHTEGEGKLKLAVKRFTTLAADNEELIRNKLHVMNCSNEFELVEIINRLSESLEKTRNVKLIIIDSITCAFIQTEGDANFDFYNNRTKRLTSIVKSLAALAWKNGIAVIITNHVAFNPKLGETRPAMGKLWAHMCPTKIFLERRATTHGVARFAYVTKGAINTPSIAPFTISDRIQG